MTLQQANELLDAAPADDTPARINPSMTKAQAVKIVRDAVNGGPRALAADGLNITDMLEKRVYQVARNQRRPRY